MYGLLYGVWLYEVYGLLLVYSAVSWQCNQEPYSIDHKGALELHVLYYNIIDAIYIENHCIKCSSSSFNRSIDMCVIR